MIKGKINFRINNQISSAEVRVIDSNGEQLGVMKIEKALDEARKVDLDLVEIAPLAKPPVVKIVNLGKFTYELEKKERKERKKSKPSELKEIRFSPFIGEHDYRVRIERINDFFKEGNKVKVVVVFLGRQMGSKEFGYALLEKILKEYEGAVAVDMKPKFLGRHLAMVISPIKKNIKVKKEDVVLESSNKQ